MDANALIARISELERMVESSAATHNSLVGRLLELRDLLSSMAETSNESVIDGNDSLNVSECTEEMVQ